MKMLGKKGHPFCGSKCCGYKMDPKHTRRMKRIERREWKKDAK